MIHPPETITISDAAAGLASAAELLAVTPDAVSRSAGLCLAVRAAELKIVRALQPVVQRYPATIQGHLAGPQSAVVGVPDAFVDPGAVIHLGDLLEMLSDPDLSCVAPRLYRGWQDRNEARRDARGITAGAVGFALGAVERDALLAALAVRNRVMLLPPPVELDVGQIDDALTAVTGLLERLG
jgi:hypothetical protein